MEDDIWESLKDYGKLYQFDTIPWGGSLPGKSNFMYGLRGSDHPGMIWLNSLTKEERTEHFDNIQKGVVKSWESADERRKTHAETMKEKWASGKLTADQARKNGNHGMRGKEVHNVKPIEYKGVTYYGWRELHEATNVTKHLYKKYYLKGIDPETRIGTNGPAAAGSLTICEKEGSV